MKTEWGMVKTDVKDAADDVVNDFLATLRCERVTTRASSYL